MIRQARCSSVSVLLPKVWDWCVRFAIWGTIEQTKLLWRGMTEATTAWRRRQGSGASSFRGDRDRASGCAPPLSCGLKVHTGTLRSLPRGFVQPGSIQHPPRNAEAPEPPCQEDVG